MLFLISRGCVDVHAGSALSGYYFLIQSIVAKMSVLLVMCLLVQSPDHTLQDERPLEEWERQELVIYLSHLHSVSALSSTSWLTMMKSSISSVCFVKIGFHVLMMHFQLLPKSTSPKAAENGAGMCSFLLLPPTPPHQPCALHIFPSGILVTLFPSRRSIEASMIFKNIPKNFHFGENSERC